MSKTLNLVDYKHLPLSNYPYSLSLHRCLRGNGIDGFVSHSSNMGYLKVFVLDEKGFRVFEKEASEVYSSKGLNFKDDFIFIPIDRKTNVILSSKDLLTVSR